MYNDGSQPKDGSCMLLYDPQQPFIREEHRGKPEFVVYSGKSMFQHLLQAVSKFV